MKEKLIKRCLTLAVLMLSLVSISTAACPRATPELYQAQCGSDLIVPAPGILKNDVKDPGKTLQVLNPEDISIDPKLGTLDVKADGSFVYEASADFAASGYAIFYYKATDGSCVSNRAIVKIAVSCPCKAIAPDVTVCQDNGVDGDLLMSMGAKCSGCGDVTPGFDLTKVADAPGTYPYKITCNCRNIAEGHVTVEQPCEVSWHDFTVAPEEVPDADMILERGQVTCSCDISPEISDIAETNDGSGYSYLITCTSSNDCSSVEDGHVTKGDAPLVTLVTLYHDAHYQGGSKQYSSDTPNIDDYFYGSMGVSSLTVSPGYAVVLYEDPNYGGRSVTFSGNVGWVGDFNDLASSLKIIEI